MLILTETVTSERSYLNFSPHGSFLQFSLDLDWVCYNVIQFWHCLPGDSIRSLQLRALSDKNLNHTHTHTHTLQKGPRGGGALRYFGMGRKHRGPEGRKLSAAPAPGTSHSLQTESRAEHRAPLIWFAKFYLVDTREWPVVWVFTRVPKGVWDSPQG